MSASRTSLLYVEDHPGDAGFVQARLGSTFDLEVAVSLAAGLERLRRITPDAVLLGVPEDDGLEALRAVRARFPALPIVVLSGARDDERALATLHAGAQDCLVKAEVEGAGLARALRYARERLAMELALKTATADLVRQAQDSRVKAARIEVLNRVLRVRAGINQLIGRELDRQRLLEQACAVAVGAGVRLAWIGVAEPDGRVRPVAWAGAGEGFLAESAIRWDAASPSQWPAGVALREDRTILLEDTTNAAEFGAWSDAARRHGFRAAVASPLHVGGRVGASLVLLTDAPLEPDPELVDLVEGTAADLGFALGALDERAQREAAEARERARTQELEAVLEAVPSAVLITDAAGQRIRGNRAAHRLLGLPPETDLRPVPTARAMLATGAGELGEVTVKLPDGTARTLLGTTAPLLDAAGAPCGQVCSFLDASDRHRAEQALREGEQRLRRVLENMPLLFQAFDEHGRPLHWNRECERVTGYAADEIVGDARAVERLFPDPSYRAHLDRQWASLRGDFQGVEVRMRCKDGAERIVAWSSVAGRVPIPEWHDWMVGVDVTDHRRTEAGMRRVSQAIEQAEEAVVITDADGVIEYANPAACKISGYATEELLGKTPRVFRSGAQDEAFYEHLWRTIRSGGTWRGNFTNRAKDGRLFHEAAVVVPVRDDAGVVVSFVAVKRSLAREQELEAQLRQAQKLEALGQLAGGVAHDFNNALTGVIGFCDLAQMMVAADPKVSGYLREVRRAGDRSASIARQLLVFSRRHAMDLGVATLNEVVESLVKMLRRFLGENITIETELTLDLAPSRMDVGQLEQVITNLCLNARDAMVSGGRIQITTANVPAAEVPVIAASGPPPRTPAGWVRLAVRDEGVGMTDDVRAHIFEPFFTTKPSGKGTGLGLAIVHGIVARHGGAVAVDTAPGRGTTFRIYLPATDAPLVAAATAAPAPPPRGSESVLVVDDDEGARHLAGSILEQLGYHPLVAASPREALDLAARPGTVVDALLSDVAMPRMSGPALAAALASSHPGLPVLYMTGHVPEWLEEQSIAANELLLKPFTAERLATRLRETIDAARAGRSSRQVAGGGRVTATSDPQDGVTWT